MYDIIIVGAGPAGLTAAIYARRAEKKVLVLEASSYGGQIINTLNIENYPGLAHISGYDFATNLYDQVKELGAEIINERVVDITENKKVVTTNNKYQAKAIILATGVKNRKLELDNEEELTGKGVSYCATCDGSFYKGKDVAVVGGGNTALEDALYLSDIVNKLYLIHRRDEFRGDSKVVSLLKEKNNIEFVYNSNIIKINGSEKLEDIEVKNNNDEVRSIKVDGLFIAIGQNPLNVNFSKLIELDENGYIKANDKCQTNIEGFFVAGDARVKELRQLVTATSDGAIAASEAVKYINESVDNN